MVVRIFVVNSVSLSPSQKKKERKERKRNGILSFTE